MTFSGAVAVVTGAAGGIGAAVCRSLARQGATVVGLDRAWPATEGAPDSSTDGPPLHARETLDVSSEEAVDAALARVASRHGPPDVVVNAAGVTYRGPTLEASAESWDEVQATNLRGTFLCCRAAGRHMLGRGSGSIVNVASQLAIAPTGERAAYVASKQGVIGLTRTLAVEWAPRGVRVNAVAPGITRTPMIEPIERDPEASAAWAARVPIGRFADPEEIASAILFLASPAASYVVGHVLVVDGGYSVP